MSKFAIAGLQLDLENNNNLPLLAKEIDTAMARFPWIDMLILGELSAYGTNVSHAQQQGDEVETFFSQLAAKHNIWLIPGSYFESKSGEIYNTATVINPDGEIVDRYHKFYPFYPYEKGVSAGDQFVVFEVPGIGKFGLMICYDQWFPEMARNLCWMGAEVIICPTMTNTIDRKNELVLAQANAISNQCYFININSVGKLGYGESIIVGPEGETIHKAGFGNELIAVELDLQRVRDVRERGLHGLGQVLKSFRDHPVDYPVYRDRKDQGAFAKLGKLAVPKSKYRKS
ncbi:MAG: carbon-nitrogen hydrolase family protein [Proteobacteria bacterium]|nr:carbon-nitrogen hydrolase family protein [Pseudomonadota bacterium]